MCAVASAAGRQICVGAGSEGQQRRDQRKAEEEKQREGEDTSHSAIVTIFVSRCVSELLFRPGGRLEFGSGEGVKSFDGAKPSEGPGLKPFPAPQIFRGAKAPR
jgi:hypothetical protein